MPVRKRTTTDEEQPVEAAVPAETVSLTAPGGSKVTVNKAAADRLKQLGFKAAK